MSEEKNDDAVDAFLAFGDDFGSAPEPLPFPGDLEAMRKYVAARYFESAVCFAGDTASVARRELVSLPQAILRGSGLWLWGADESTFVHDIRAGLQSCFALSRVAIPGLYFEAGLSFTEFEKLLEKAPERWSHERLKKRPVVPDHQRIHMLTVEIGNSLTLDISGPVTHAVMWGNTVL